MLALTLGVTVLIIFKRCYLSTLHFYLFLTQLLYYAQMNNGDSGRSMSADASPHGSENGHSPRPVGRSRSR